MENKKSVGALKSWTCVAVLTFFVPAAGFELSTVIFSASSTASQAVSQYLMPSESVARPVVISCRGKAHEEII